MGKQVQVNQTSREEKVYPLEYAPSLLEGVTLENIVFTYTTDNDDDDLPNLDSVIDGTMAYIKISNLSVGFHRIGCLATTSDEDLSPEIELLITVKT